MLSLHAIAFKEVQLYQFYTTSVLAVALSSVSNFTEKMKKCEQLLSLLMLIALRISRLALGQDIPAPVAACDRLVYNV